ncbi:hypothetical protein GOV08_05515, partial [Candidatus Woesearchaeota archaeon]|nr:hypothetical protein [Candidatus Woesearchaeota archaeon]
MKSAISIQEFKPFAENILYLKDDKQWLWLGNELREEPVELILFLGKYKGFTKEDVLSDIRKRAPNALNGDLRKMSSLERYLSGFDPKVIKDLSNGEQTVMEKFDFYAGHIKFVNSSIQPEYLVVNHSILPKELIEYAKENGDLDIDWYNKAIMDKSLFDLGIGIRFIMEIMIER